MAGRLCGAVWLLPMPGLFSVTQGVAGVRGGGCHSPNLGQIEEASSSLMATLLLIGSAKLFLESKPCGMGGPM